MYFWNINKLKSDFIEGAVTEKNTLQYLIAYTVLVGMVMIPYCEPNQYDMLSAALVIPISVLGILYAYSCNGADSGDNFLAKYFAISWVITVRFIAYIILLIFLIGIIAGMSGADIPEATTFLDVVVNVILTAFIYWRIAIHIKETTISFT